jgi:hypothetical protein
MLKKETPAEEVLLGAEAQCFSPIQGSPGRVKIEKELKRSI